MVTSPTTSASYALSFSLRTPSAGPKLVTRTMEVGVHCQCTAISERASPMAVTESSRLRLRTGGSTIHTHSATSGCQPHCNLAMGFVIMGRCRRCGSSDHNDDRYCTQPQEDNGEGHNPMVRTFWSTATRACCSKETNQCEMQNMCAVNPTLHYYHYRQQLFET